MIPKAKISLTSTNHQTSAGYKGRWKLTGSCIDLSLNLGAEKRTLEWPRYDTWVGGRILPVWTHRESHSSRMACERIRRARWLRRHENGAKAWATCVHRPPYRCAAIVTKGKVKFSCQTFGAFLCIGQTHTYAQEQVINHIPNHSSKYWFPLKNTGTIPAFL